MKSIALTLATALVATALVGCESDKTVAKTERTSENPLTGSTTHKETTVKERPDGSLYRESTKKTTND